MTECAGVILAGGGSSRMGADKVALRYKGKTLLVLMQDLLGESELEDIYISHPDYIADDVKGLGPLAGLQATLKASGSKHKHLLYVPVDMPGLNRSVLKPLLDAPHDKMLVRYRSYNMPFRLQVEGPVQGLLDEILKSQSNLSMGYFFDQIESKYILEPGSNLAAFININTEGDWQAFLQSKGR